MKILLRPIKKEDNQQLAELIRTVFREFKIDKPGTVYTDSATDHLYKVFQTPKSNYWIAEENGILLGGCGIYPTEGLADKCVELVKFYLSDQARGKGIGKELMQKALESAKEFGYQQVYLESFPELSKAVGMYQKMGFETINQALGNSGHYACNIFMIKNL